MQEVDTETVLKCSKVVVDTIKGVKDEAGDLIIPANAGLWSFENLHGKLGQLVTSEITGRENKDEITFFKSVGIAYFDMAVAAAVYEKNKQAGIRTEVEL